MESSFAGRYRYKSSAEAAEQSGHCRVTVDDRSLQVMPEKGAPIAMDLGDIDEYAPGDYELALILYDGSRLVLSHFAKTFQNLAHDLLAAYRERMIQCLLLEDLEEVVRIEGTARFESRERSFSSQSEIRLYGSNLAILPERAAGLQWRFADIDSVVFDEANYSLELRSFEDRLVLGKLAKRTGELEKQLKSSMSDVAEKAAGVIQALFPFLSSSQFQKLAGILKEGRAASIAEMNLIHPGIGPAFAERTISANLRPYFDLLRQNAAEPELFAGFKLVRQGAEEEAGEPGDGAAETQTDLPEISEGPPVVYWYFLPIRGARESLRNLVAWEMVSGGGRATYFFRMVPKEQEELLQNSSQAGGLVGDSIRRLNQALVLLNFRREPIYLKDESLQLQPRFKRYAIACRKIPVLRRLRSAFVGRAIHSSLPEWEEQVRQILASA